VILFIAGMFSGIVISFLGMSVGYALGQMSKEQEK
jgi:hypothetical protein